MYQTFANLEETTRNLSLNSVLFGSLTLIALVVISILLKDKEKLKMPLFSIMTAVILGVTAVISISTIYLNIKSETGGPVHWHADIEFWACDTELEIRDPTAWYSNKIGTNSYHEHDDKRIHLEGVALDKSVDASLGRFMEVIGGEITSSSLKLPVNGVDDYIELDRDGDHDSSSNSSVKTATKPFPDEAIATDGKYAIATFDESVDCPNSPGSSLQTYVYRTNPANDKEYYQEKLTDPASHVMAEESTIPTGDCLIVEFGPLSETTDKLCKQYGIFDTDMCVDFGVPEENKAVCDLKEIQKPGAGCALDSVSCDQFDTEATPYIPPQEEN